MHNTTASVKVNPPSPFFYLFFAKKAEKTAFFAIKRHPSPTIIPHARNGVEGKRLKREIEKRPMVGSEKEFDKGLSGVE